MAQIIGMEDLLAHIPSIEADLKANIEGGTVRLLQVRQQLSDELLLALFDAFSIAAELECEKARAEDLATRLEEVQDNIQQRRTVIAIMADSISGLLAGTFLFAGATVISGMADFIGSGMALGFGYAALGGDQENELLHSRNLLAEVWEGPEQSNRFPPSVWRFLNWPMEKDGARSRREALMARWQSRFGKPGSDIERRRLKLFFGDGGIYKPDDLRYRGEMIGLLKARVNLMSQDLTLLFRESLSHFSRLGQMS